MTLREFKPAGYVNLALASWVLCSAYVWRHDGAQFVITILVGALLAIVTPFELAEFSGSPRVRKLTTAAGLMLTASALLLPRISAVTTFHNAVLGLAIAIVSLIGP